MACVALTSLMGTIELEFLHPNHRMSLCLDDEKLLKSVFEKLSSMEAFLKEEYNNAVSSGAPIRRHLLNKIRDFALKAEDAIEIQLTNILQLQQKDHEGELHLHLHRTLQQVAKEAEELLKVINNQVEVANHDSLPLIGWSEAAASHPHNIIEKEGGSLQCSPQLEEEDTLMLGRNYYYFALMRINLLNSLSRSVLTIVGAPGIGKTTFCKKLYTDSEVVSHFEIQAWITIPPRYNGDVQQLLCHLLQSMRPTPLNQEIDMQGSTVSQLKDQLHKHLKKCKRYLIVLDDVPNTLLWDDIRQCFPDDKNGSGILLTTLFTDVAEYITKRWNIKTLFYLRDNESWNLFSNRFSLKHHMTPKFEEIAKHLVEECRGLPRSIVTVADRLSKCNYTLKEWKKIEKELLSLGILHRDTQHSMSGASGCRNRIIILENFEDLLRLEALTVMIPVGSITLLERVGFPAKLKSLRLSGTNFPVKVLKVIGQLPKLKVLKLENAFYGRVWEVVEGGFPKLIHLEVESRNLERWVANTSNFFPNLVHILLKRCYSLEEIPPVNAKHRLYSIKLEQCPPSVVTSAKRYQEEIAHNKPWVPFIVVDDKNLHLVDIAACWGGEIGVLCYRPQLFTIRTKRLSQLLRMNRTAFMNIIQANVDDGTIIMNNLFQHLKDMRDPIMEGVLLETENMLAHGRMDLPLTLCFATLRGDDLLLHYLLKRGLDPNESDNNGRTALHIAAVKGYENCVLLLLDCGADPNSRDSEGSVPLWEAILGEHESVTKLLADKELNYPRVM
ncbi:PREDICTED: uncharacterized protein LOC109179505 [Ipomoea nil]|uniref:uncharacterized protein LOC109179505 n=1 Tax=Ipomoea nil TaxID=35883 RepID=UPI0009009661|nr:PREDICTED: uncharacterized protein LOC109179505 [Ipomoea nil]